jgi:hypothetical protein
VEDYAMKTTTRCIAALSVLLCLSACSDLVVPNYNAASQEDLAANPTPAAVSAVAQGLLSGQRGLTSGYVVTTGTWGREIYNLRPEEPRTITNQLIDPIDGSTAFWSGNYTQIKNIKVVLAAADAAEGLTDEEKEAVRGFAYTLWAEALFHVNLMHGELGAPIDVPDDPRELAPIVAEDAVYTEVFRLYDEAATHLQNGGSSFPFSLTPGLADFDTPANFLEVNRALKVRALKYTDNWAEVLSTLPQTFVDDGAPLTFGAYHSYSSRSGDTENTICCSVAYYAHPRIRADAQLQTDGVTLDQRALDKTYSVAEFKLLGISATEKFGGWTGFNDLEDPRSWIRNEELILIRAEANLATGDATAALQDVNLIRTTSGNLPAIDAATWAGLTADEQLTEILYNKFMSLVLEGGFTYLDHRQYGRLDLLPRATDADTGADLGHVVYPRYPYPTNECLARDITDSAACQIVVGT